ncbi:MAG: hypothetical protein J2P13_06555 [Acidobacteria bacterium]|nr:hypothetical protein [Acidobacteriota bacterium]
MSPSRAVTAIAASILVAGMAAQAVLVRRLDEPQAARKLQEVLYISSPELVKRLSLGYDGLLANIYWTRAVQYFGREHNQGGGEYRLLWPLLNITTQLDPQLIPAYEFGATFLSARPPHGAGLPEKAIELVRHGIESNPGNWRLYYNLGFVYYDLRDYRNSAEAFLRGSEIPGAHPFMKVLAAQMAQHGGDLATARTLWTATYETSPDPLIRSNAARHLQAIAVDEDVTRLERVVDRYREHRGRAPKSFSELVSAGFLNSLPLDPRGEPYRLESGGRVVVSDPGELPFIEKGLPETNVRGRALKQAP